MTSINVPIFAIAFILNPRDWYLIDFDNDKIHSQSESDDAIKVITHMISLKILCVAFTYTNSYKA